jgi:hypothetical protein
MKFFLLVTIALLFFRGEGARAQSSPEESDYPDMQRGIPGSVAVDGQLFKLKASMQQILGPEELFLSVQASEHLIRTELVSRESYLLSETLAGADFWRKINQFSTKVRAAELGDLESIRHSISIVLLSSLNVGLADKDRLVVHAEGLLQGFPFELLEIPASKHVTGERSDYLIEKFAVVYTGSIRQWMMNRIISREDTGDERKNQISFVGISPGFRLRECIEPLPEALRELKGIAEIFRQHGRQAVILPDELGCESNFKSFSKSGRIIHISTHTLSGGGSTDRNGLLFYEFGAFNVLGSGDDGLLSPGEIRDLQFKADLIVISSCGSAMSQVAGRKQGSSLPELFIQAGARNVICTLWNLSDKAANRFMLLFYRNYLNGMTYDRALQQAKRTMIRNGDTSLPFVWAGFVLMEA